MWYGSYSFMATFQSCKESPAFPGDTHSILGVPNTPKKTKLKRHQIPLKHQMVFGKEPGPDPDEVKALLQILTHDPKIFDCG